MNETVFLILILLLSIGLPFFLNRKGSFHNNMEGYSNYVLEGENASVGKFPSSETEVLVQDTYPITGRNGISNDSAATIWWHYPTFQLGSYDQITNNIRYSNNPDEGTCMPASMCGALYKEKQYKSNYVYPLPPVVNPPCGTRVGYFITQPNRMPYQSALNNILY
jgi:hypothetical protein